jgi:hypothetical protein
MSKLTVPDESTALVAGLLIILGAQELLLRSRREQLSAPAMELIQPNTQGQ